MTGEQMIALAKRHTLFEWAAQGKVDPIPVAGAKGAYFWTPEGKRYLDFNSQLMCVNAGHGDARIVRAIQEQAAKLAYVSPHLVTEVRARLGAKLAEIAPGDIETFFFTNGGADANENAIRIARLVTGRHKILARYRSYHGGTAGSLTLDRRSAAVGRRAGHPGRRARARPVPRPRARLGHGGRGARAARGGHRAGGAADDCGVHPRAGDRHQRRARAAGRLPRGRARALHEARHPDDRRRGDVGLRPDRRVVRGRPLERGARPDLAWPRA